MTLPRVSAAFSHCTCLCRSIHCSPVAPDHVIRAIACRATMRPSPAASTTSMETSVSRKHYYETTTVENTRLRVLQHPTAHLMAVDKPFDVAMSGAHPVLLDGLVARWVGGGWHYAHQIDMATSGCVLYTG